ncbi:glucose-6-phosphate isomerase [Eubacteriales bacterium OttesenSCG-928-M02]|nr:glucose-6-phosphate isomerase [Eubacteriales bacterium OttesenSCG-928-M02]
MEQKRIRLDYNNMLESRVGAHGISEGDFAQYDGELAAAAQRMEEKIGQMDFRSLPMESDAVADAIIATAKEVQGKFDAFVVLGIGGSALGPLAVHTAIKHLRYNELSGGERKYPRLYVEDNVDPERMAALFDVIELKTTCFNVISKSGTTSETMSQFMVIADALKKAGLPLKDHVIATTDEKNGNLRKLVEAEGLKSFIIPDGIGGRFSELSPVGLLAAAVCGIDIKQLLAGAAYMEEICRKAGADYKKNIAYMDGALQYMSDKKGANISVMIPYADSLKYVADWYAQLWAESLGRENGYGKGINVGQTPVKALGVTDQHSQIQLYVEGPYDKVITVIGVDEYRTDIPIPNAFPFMEDLAFLDGHTMGELIQTEQFATCYALNRAGRMNKTITLPVVDEFTIGQLLQLFMIETAYYGELLGVNPFNQPGVEEGKNATYALFGRKGYEEKRAEMEAAPQPEDAYIL